MSCLAACQHTGTVRCDGLLQPQAEGSASLGGHERCDPPVSFSWPPGALGWTDGKTLTAWLRADLMPDDRTLQMIAWHELGHIWEYRTGRYVHDETRASQYGWCAGGRLLSGVAMPGWGPPPEGCAFFA